MKILFVEDEAISILSMKVDLNKAGFQDISTVSSGERALDFMKNNHVDLILMDVGLAGNLNGIETSEQIREFSDVPIIFISGYSNPEMKEIAARVSPIAFLVKPFKRKELIEILQGLHIE
jgi:two-component SAPR family response regulator